MDHTRNIRIVQGNEIMNKKQIKEYYSEHIEHWVWRIGTLVVIYLTIKYVIQDIVGG